MIDKNALWLVTGPDPASVTHIVHGHEETAGKTRNNLVAAHGAQQNDPMLGAEATVTASKAGKRSMHLLSGSDAPELARRKVADLQHDFDMWKELTTSTKFHAAGGFGNRRRDLSR